MDKVGRGLSSAISSYDKALGSLERSVLPSARKLTELHVQDGGKQIADLSPLGKVPRSLTATELLREADSVEETAAEEEIKDDAA
jgi:DNA recombination protein RmuC